MPFCQRAYCIRSRLTVKLRRFSGPQWRSIANLRICLTGYFKLMESNSHGALHSSQKPPNSKKPPLGTRKAQKSYSGPPLVKECSFIQFMSRNYSAALSVMSSAQSAQPWRLLLFLFPQLDVPIHLSERRRFSSRSRPSGLHRFRSDCRRDAALTQLLLCRDGNNKNSGQVHA